MEKFTSYLCDLFHSRLIRMAMAVVVVFVVFLIGLVAQANNFDYPITILSAERALAGQRPYIDFYNSHGPVGTYVMAFTMWLLGAWSHTEAVNLFASFCAVFYFGLVSWQIYKLSARRPVVSVILLLYLIALMPIVIVWGYYSLLAIILLALTLLASERIYCDHLSLSEKMPAIFLVSAIAAVSLLMRLNFGLYIIFAVGVIGIWRFYFHATERKAIAVQFFVLAVLIATVLMVFYWSGQASPYLRDMMDFFPRYKTRHYPLSQLLEYRESAILLLFFGLTGLAVVAVAIGLVLRRQVQGGFYGLILLVCLTHFAWQRFDLGHVYPIMLLLPLVWICADNDLAADDKQRGARSDSFLSRSLQALLGCMILVMASYRHESSNTARQAIRYWQNGRSGHGSPVVRNNVRILRDEARMLDELAREYGPDTGIFWASMPGNCEGASQYGANILLYVAEGRIPEPKIWFFDTITTAYPDVQKRLIDDVEHLKIKRIAMQGPIYSGASNSTNNIKESTLFLEYVLARYQFEKRFLVPEGNRYYDIYSRKKVIETPLPDR